MRGGATLHALAQSGSSARSGTGGGDLIAEAFEATWAEMPTMLRRVRLDRPRRYRIAAARNRLQRRAALQRLALDGVAQLSPQAQGIGLRHGRSLAVAPRASDEFKFAPELWCLARVPASLVRLSVENL